jgi:hypothetical protein
MTLGGVDVYIVAVGSNKSGKVEVFFLSSSGQILDGTIIGSTGQVQPHLTLPIPPIDATTNYGVREMAMGDANGDGVPDIVIGNKFHGKAYVLVSSSQNGVVSYSAPFLLLPPENQSGFSAGVAMGELDGNPGGIPGDEVVIGSVFGTTADQSNGKVFVYKYNNSTFTWIVTLSSPVTGKKGSDGFGFGVATGDVTSGAAPDLIVTANGVGKVFAFPGYIPSNPPVSLSAAGYKARADDVDGDSHADVVASVLSTSVQVFSGPVSTGQAPKYTLTPVAGLGSNFGQDIETGDVNGDFLAEVLSGAPNASNCPSIDSVGAAYVYLSTFATPAQPPTPYLLQPPSLGDVLRYGWSVGTAPGSRLFFVGETGRIINGVATGQVYVYRVN